MKITFSNVQPNSKESRIWLDEKGLLRTYNQKQLKWAHGTVSSEPDDKPMVTAMDTIVENGVYERGDL